MTPLGETFTIWLLLGKKMFPEASAAIDSNGWTFEGSMIRFSTGENLIGCAHAF
jgi:hypothetical protein